MNYIRSQLEGIKKERENISNSIEALRQREEFLYEENDRVCGKLIDYIVDNKVTVYPIWIASTTGDILSTVATTVNEYQRDLEYHKRFYREVLPKDANGVPANEEHRDYLMDCLMKTF